MISQPLKFLSSSYRIVSRKLARPYPKVLRGHRRSRVNGVSVVRYGRLGNNLIQIANAIILAEVAGFRYIRTPKIPFLDLQQPIQSGGLCLLPSGLPTRTYGTFIEGTFYRPPTLDTGVLSQAARRQALHQHVIPLMSLPQPVPTQNTDLVIHVRSGDIFSTAPHPGFIQPPLAYYVNILAPRFESGEIERVKIVFEDRKNPCIDALVDFCRGIGVPVIQQSGTLEEDLAHLLGAQNLVFGTGSFGPAVCFLSKHAQQIHCFDSLGGFYEGFKDIGEITHWKAVEDYYINENDWRNTPEQRQLMLDLPTSAVRPALQ